MLPISFRRAHPDDVDRLVEIHFAAYPDDRGFEARRRNFMGKPFGPFADLHVAVRDEGLPSEDLVGHAFGFGLVVGVGGRQVPMTGIATVGVAPEARGQGVGRAIVAHVISEGERAGAVGSFLFPFRQAFYARLGYTSAPPVHHVPVALAALRALGGAGRRVRRAKGEDRPLLEALYRTYAHVGTGLVARTERLWTSILADERLVVVVLDDGEKPSGYAMFRFEQAEPHAAQRVRVTEIVGETTADRLAVLGWLGTLSDQATEADLEMAFDDPLLDALLDHDPNRLRPGTARIEHALGTLGAGPMLRLASVPRALAARGYTEDGRVELDVDGERFGLLVRAGVGEVVPPGPGEVVTLTTTTLTRVAYGGASLFRAWLAGSVRASRGAAREADRVLSVPAFFTLDRF